MSTENSLLPCPCCGADPVRRPYQVVINDWGRTVESGVVFCIRCGLNLETSCGQLEAEKRWNKRENVSSTRLIEFVGKGHPPIEKSNEEPL